MIPEDHEALKHARANELIYWWKKDGFLYRKLANELIALLVEFYEGAEE